MFLLEKLMPWPTIDIAKRNRVTERLDELTRWAHREQPDEFLDDAAYEPYVAFGRTVHRDLGALLIDPPQYW